MYQRFIYANIIFGFILLSVGYANPMTNPADDMHLSALDTIFIPGDTIKIKDTVYIYTTEDPFRWEIEFQNGLYISSGKYDITGEDVEISEFLNEETRYRGSFYSNVSVNFYYYNWIIQSGLSYLGLREEVAHKPTNLLIEEIRVIDNIVIDTFYTLPTPDDTVFTYVTVPREIRILDSTYLNTPYTNLYSYLEIPLITGYTWHQDRFSYIAKAGIIAGFYIPSKKKIISVNNSNELYNVNQDKNIRNINLSFQIDLRFQYNYSENIALFVEPSFRQFQKSVFNNRFPANIKPFLFGIKGGINIKL